MFTWCKWIFTELIGHLMFSWKPFTVDFRHFCQCGLQTGGLLNFCVAKINLAEILMVLEVHNRNGCQKQKERRCIKCILYIYVNDCGFVRNSLPLLKKNPISVINCSRIVGGNVMHLTNTREMQICYFMVFLFILHRCLMTMKFVQRSKGDTFE